MKRAGEKSQTTRPWRVSKEAELNQEFPSTPKIWSRRIKDRHIVKAVGRALKWPPKEEAGVHLTFYLINVYWALNCILGKTGFKKKSIGCTFEERCPQWGGGWSGGSGLCKSDLHRILLPEGPYPWPTGDGFLGETILELNLNWWIRMNHLKLCGLEPHWILLGRFFFIYKERAQGWIHGSHPACC